MLGCIFLDLMPQGTGMKQKVNWLQPASCKYVTRSTSEDAANMSVDFRLTMWRYSPEIKLSFICVVK
jgi:hypothetical protein